jgi:prophage DNA circulation protein
VTESVGIIQTQTKLKVKSSSVDVENIEGKINAFDNFMRDSARILTDLSTLIAEPQTLGYKLIDVVSRMVDMVDTPLHAVAGYSRMYSALSDYFGGLSFLSSAKGDTEKQNAEILRDVLLLAVLSYAATAAADADYETRTQATQTRDSLTDMIDSFLADALDDSMFESALDLRNSVVKSVPPEGARLPDLVSVDVPATVSSLVLAHEIYGDLDEEADLISRNSVASPWAIQGGTSVEALL